MFVRRVLLLVLVLSLAGCVSSGRYRQKHDSAPTRVPTAEELQDLTPKYEPYHRKGNGKYQVFGVNYKTMESGEGFSQTGSASWYGKKFHGHLTSNGEIYNMYGLSAAHKTLPIPSYVRVTNLNNKKQVVVRVNDRGPFHGNRIIDLSYGAAYKLDMLKTGTTKVKIDVITVDPQGNVSIAGEEKPGYYIQVAAVKEHNKAKEMAKGLTVLYQVPSEVPKKGKFYRLRLGPIQDSHAADTLLKQLKNDGYRNAYMLSPQ